MDSRLKNAIQKISRRLFGIFPKGAEERYKYFSKLYLKDDNAERLLMEKSDLTRFQNL